MLTYYQEKIKDALIFIAVIAMFAAMIYLFVETIVTNPAHGCDSVEIDKTNTKTLGLGG